MATINLQHGTHITARPFNETGGNKPMVRVKAIAAKPKL
jgi:hypothetical protein